MTATPIQEVKKPEEKEKKPEVKEALQNAEEQTKYARHLIINNIATNKDTGVPALIKRFPGTSPETAGRVYDEASKQLIVMKYENHARDYIRQCLSEGTHPDAYSLTRMFPQAFGQDWQRAKEFQERIIKEFGNSGNHKLPKAETIPPVTPLTLMSPKPPAPLKSDLSNSKTTAATATQPTATKTPPVIIPNGIKPSPKYEVRTRVLKPDEGQVSRSPLWRAFNVYSDDPRTEEILLESVVTNVFSPRATVDDDYIKSLADSLGEDGQERAIVVTPREGRLAVVSGECRVLAARRLGWTKLRGLSVALTDDQAIGMAMAANLEHGLPHKPLTKVEEAKVLQKLTNDPHNWSQERAGTFFGKGQRWVSYRLGLLKTDESVQKGLEEDKLTERHARSLADLPKPVQAKVAEKIAERDLSVRETEQLVNGIKSQPEPERLTPKEIDGMISDKRAEAATARHEAILHGPSKPLVEVLRNVGAVKLHKDEDGIYFLKFECETCGTQHAIDINIEEGIAQVRGPRKLAEETEAA